MRMCMCVLTDCMCAVCVVLGNISTFWKYRDIYLTIRTHVYHIVNFLISTHHVSIFIVRIYRLYVTHEIYNLDMSTVYETQKLDNHLYLASYIII